MVTDKPQVSQLGAKSQISAFVRYQLPLPARMCYHKRDSASEAFLLCINNATICVLWPEQDSPLASYQASNNLTSRYDVCAFASSFQSIIFQQGFDNQGGHIIYKAWSPVLVAQQTRIQPFSSMGDDYHGRSYLYGALMARSDTGKSSIYSEETHRVRIYRYSELMHGLMGTLSTPP